jgi:hypothetical protein
MNTKLIRDWILLLLVVVPITVVAVLAFLWPLWLALASLKYLFA